MRRTSTKSKILLPIAIITTVLFCFQDSVFENQIVNIMREKNYTIINEEAFDFTISIPKSLLKDSIYTSTGCEFEKEEVVVYKTETTSIYLEKVMLAYEGDDMLYFMFNYSYDLPKSGCILVPYGEYEIGLRSKAITDEEHTYPDSVFFRGTSSTDHFELYVSTDICKKAMESIQIQACCNKVTYAKDKILQF